MTASGWTGWRDGFGMDTHFRVTLNEKDAHMMSRRQIDDFYAGIALIAAAFQPDERFAGIAPEPMDRVASVRFDERLDELLP